MLLRFFAILNMSEFYSSPKYALRINGYTVDDDSTVAWWRFCFVILKAVATLYFLSICTPIHVQPSHLSLEGYNVLLLQWQ